MEIYDQLKSLLETDHSKNQTNKIIEFVGDDEEKMSALMSFFLDKKWPWRYNQWAAWPIGYIGRMHPKLIYPYFKKMISAMDNPAHPAVLRNIIRICEDIKIPGKYEGEIYERCFKFLNDPNQAIAVRCFSMQVVFNIAQKYPELQDEFKASIKLHLPYGSAGFKSRANRFLNMMQKQQ